MKNFEEFTKQISPEWKLYERAMDLHQTVDFGMQNRERYSAVYDGYNMQCAFMLALLERYHQWLDN